MKKKLISTIMLLATISILTTAPTYAKRANYCSVALERCYGVCSNSVLAYACDTGCNIGYLFCG